MGKTVNPFPGLRPFRMDERHLFFGREEHTSELLQRLCQSRFLAVVGTSGSGKSSLVTAGVLPELFRGTLVDAGSHWESALMRPGGDPLTNLSQALIDADLYDPEEPEMVHLLRSKLQRSGLGLVDAVRQSELDANANLLLVVDQFEEIFRFQSAGARGGEEAAEFVQLLLEASRHPDSRLYIILTMRSDYLGDCPQFPSLAEAVNAGEYLIPRMNRAQRRAAIEGPVKVGGGNMAPRLLQKLLNDVGDNPDQLPVLQHALMRSWDHWAGDRLADEPIDLRHYTAIGQLNEALSQHADEIFDSLPGDRHRQVAELVFKALTEKGSDNRGIRRPTRFDQLCLITNADKNEMIVVIEAFRQPGVTFLMPGPERDLHSDTVIDISHESLMRIWHRLRQWVDEEAQSAQIYRRMAETARLYRDGQAGLYRDPDLQIALEWRDATQPTEAWAFRYHDRFEEATAFLAQSQVAAIHAAQEQEAARERELIQAKALARSQTKAVKIFRRFAVALTVGLIIALALSVWAMALRKSALAAKADAIDARSISQESLIQMHVARGVNELEAAEPAKALPWLVKALELDAGDPKREQRHRVRIGQVLNHIPNLRRFWRKPGLATTVAFSADGEYALATGVISGGKRRPEGGLKVWHVSSNTAIKTTERPLKILDADFSPVEALLATLDSSTSEVQIWDLKTGQEVARGKEPHRGGHHLAFSPDGTKLVSFGYNRLAKLWDVKTGRLLISSFDIPKGSNLRSAEFSPVSENLLIYDYSGRVYGFDVNSGDPNLPVLRHPGRPLYLKYHSMGDFFATASGKANHVQMWDARSGEARQAIHLPSPISSFDTSPDGQFIAITSYEGEAGVWNPHTGELVSASMKRAGATLSMIQFSPDSQYVATASGNHTVQVWNALTGAAVGPAMWHSASVQSVAFHPSGRFVLTGCVDGSVRIWSVVKEAKPRRTLPSKEAVAFLEVDQFKTRILTISTNQVLQVWDVKTRREVGSSIQLDPQMNRAAFVPQSDLIAAWTEPNETPTVAQTLSVQVWNVETGRPALAPFTSLGLKLSSEEPYSRCALDPLGKKMVVALGDEDQSEVKMWNLQDDESSIKLGGSTPLQHLTISPDGDVLALVHGHDQFKTNTPHEVSFWSMKTGQLLSEPITLAKFSGPCAFSPDGRHFALATFSLPGDDRADYGSLQAWKVPDGEPVFGPAFWSGDPTILRYDKNAKRQRLLVAHDTRARILDAATGQPITPPMVHSGKVQDARFSPNGVYVMSIDGSERLYLREASSGLPITVPILHPAVVTDARFLSDDQMVTTCEDGLVRIWDLRPDERPINELKRLSRLYSGHRIDETDALSPLNTEECEEDWLAETAS